MDEFDYKCSMLLAAIEAVVADTSTHHTWQAKKAKLYAMAGNSSDSGISFEEFASWFE
jgi:hypothetical protein